MANSNETLRRLREAHDRVPDLALRKEAAITETREAGHFSQLVYSGRPDPYLVFLRGAHKYHHAIIDYQNQSASPTLPEEFTFPDFFQLPVHGVTLANIEKLEYPLTKKGIATINQLIHANWICELRGHDPFSQQVKIQTILLPTQSLARADLPGRNKDRPFPQNLQPLTDRLTGYLDHYLPFLTDVDQNMFSNPLAYKSIAWVGKNLLRGLGLYIPARLGISPSSAIKAAERAFEGQSDTENFFMHWSKERYLRAYKKEAAAAFRPDMVPSNLHRYLQHSPEQDKEAAKRLEIAYQSMMAEYPRDKDAVDAEFALRRADLMKTITAAKNQLQFKTKVGTMDVDVIATTQYGKSVTFVIRFKDGSTHLTLDLTKNDQLFGLPPSTSVRHPIIETLLTRSLMKSASEAAKDRYPDKVSIYDLPPSPASLIPHPRRNTREPRVINFADTDNESPKTTRFQAIRSLIAQFNPNQPPIPDQVTPSVIVNPVNITPERIREMVGPKVPEKKVRQLWADFKLFEIGGKRRRKLSVTDKVAEDDRIRFQSGSFRAVLRPNGPTYDVLEIADKKDVSYHK